MLGIEFICVVCDEFLHKFAHGYATVKTFKTAKVYCQVVIAACLASSSSVWFVMSFCINLRMGMRL